MKDLDRRTKALFALARARQADFPEEDQRVYMLGLDDVSDDTLAEACFQLLKRPRGQHETAMPTVGDIRAEAGRAYDRHKALPPKSPAHIALSAEEPTYRCARCQDIGWIFVSCPGGARRVCGRPDKLEWVDEGGPNAIASAPCLTAHSYVRPCVCDGRHGRKVSAA